MLGLSVEVISEVSGSAAGQVMCHGEIWRAKSEEGVIEAGSKGVVKAVDGMTLFIARE